jgi:2-polyprenyl-3-methyl-5-hydroxy-6-metoxy-1,4-benzoquinol methylase
MAVGETFIPGDRNGRCPGCGCGAPQLLPGTGKPFEFRTRSLVFLQNEYRILRCGACGLVFKDSILSEEMFGLLYGDVDFSTWSACRIYPTERPVLKHLQSLPADSRVLDYGCSTGRLLEQVKPEIGKWGYEVNNSAAQEAAAKGIQMIGEREDLKSFQKTFDAVVVMDVFEHLANPTALLLDLAALVKPSGVLVVSTGNADCRACETDIPNFWYFRSIQHLCMITKHYAKAFAEWSGFRLASWRECSHYDTKFFNRMAQHLRQRVYAFRHRHPGSVISLAMDRLPALYKSATWKIPPPYSASRDHAVVFFERP